MGTQGMMGPAEIRDEIVINHDLTIPPGKPPMEKLLDYRITYDIASATVIGTPLSTSGQPPLPIRKVIIDGVARIVIKYAALVPDQQVHGAHFDIPFNDLIEWPGGPAPGSPVCVDVVEEYASVRQKDCCHLCKAMVLQLNIRVGEGGVIDEC